MCMMNDYLKADTAVSHPWATREKMFALWSSRGACKRIAIACERNPEKEK